MSHRSLFLKICAVAVLLTSTMAVAGPDFEPRHGLDENGYPRQFTFDEILVITPRFDHVQCLVGLLPQPRTVGEAALFIDRVAASMIQKMDFSIAATLQATYFEGAGVEYRDGFAAEYGAAAGYDENPYRTGPSVIMDGSLQRTSIFSRLLLLHEVAVHMAHYEFWRAEEARVSAKAELEFQMVTELVAHQIQFAIGAAIPEHLWVEDIAGSVDDPQARARYDALLSQLRETNRPMPQRLQEVAAQYLSLGMGLLSTLNIAGADEAAFGASLAPYINQRSAEEYVALFLAQSPHQPVVVAP